MPERYTADTAAEPRLQQPAPENRSETEVRALHRRLNDEWHATSREIESLLQKDDEVSVARLNELTTRRSVLIEQLADVESRIADGA